MRWERLFAELEGQATDDALSERDALIEDLRQGEWATTGWWQLCGGRAGVEVVGLGRIDGVIVSANQHVLQVRTAREDVLVNAAHVLGVLAPARRAQTPTAVDARLGLRHALRACQRDADRVRIHRVDASMRAGVVEQVGQDFVSLREDSGTVTIVPLAMVAAFSCPL